MTAKAVVLEDVAGGQQLSAVFDKIGKTATAVSRVNLRTKCSRPLPLKHSPAALTPSCDVQTFHA